MMEKFRVVVWCESCRGDDEGCFGGGNEVIQGAFESFEEAEQAGLHYCADLPYEYRIVHGMAEVQQACDVFTDVLNSAVAYGDVIRTLQMAQQTLKESMSQESDLLCA